VPVPPVTRIGGRVVSIRGVFMVRFPLALLRLVASRV
jgi:hypothetical protein